MKIYNTLSRTIEELFLVKDKPVGIYSCGPTVYDRVHIGNLSTFLFVDLLRRWLDFRGYIVKHVMNITDVDDKTIRGAEKRGISLKEYTEEYSDLFFKDLKALGIKEAHYYPRATDNINEMVALIKILLDKGYAYEKEGSIYYRISKFPTYGHFAGIKMEEISNDADGVDTDEYSEKETADFVLWKKYKPEEDGEVFWETEIGKGRPGWHIECSAMSWRYLGESFDIHTGAVDLIFPHHQNEIAQSEAAFGKRFVKYWMHRSHLTIEKGKMSKSEGNAFTLNDIAKSNSDRQAFRFMVISSHYRTPLDFSKKSFQAAKRTVAHLREFCSRLAFIEKDGSNNLNKKIGLVYNDIVDAIDNDFKTPEAIAHLFSFISEIEKEMGGGKLTKGSADSVLYFMRSLDNILLLFSFKTLNLIPLTLIQKVLIKQRKEARELKNFEKADEIREFLLKEGIILEDTEDGTKHFRSQS